MSGTWASGWTSGDIVTAAEFAKGVGESHDTVLGIAAANIDFQSIPSGYKNLLLIVSGASDQAGAQNSLLRFNNDSGANYDYEQMAAAAAAVTTAETFAATSMALGNLGTTTAGTLAGQIVFIPNYAATTLNKMAIIIGGHKVGTTSGNVVIKVTVAWWRSTAAINRLTWLSGVGNLAIGSRATLYVMG